MKNSLRHGVIINKKRLYRFQAILWQWIKNIEKFSQAFSNVDAPYWYNERATLSTFAGAIWRTGGIALEEYTSKKIGKNENWKGRIDLWFQFKQKMYVVEAKQHWCLIDEERLNKGLVKDRMQRRLTSAVSNAVETPVDEGDPIGIVFVVPKIRQRSISLLHTFLKVLDEVKPDFIAWNFPRCCANLRWRNFLFPGVALIGKRTKR